MFNLVEELSTRLQSHFGDTLTSCQVATGQVAIEVPKAALLETCETLRETPEFAFEQLIDVCGVDYSAYGQADWQTQEASTSGFSRAVSANVEQPLKNNETNNDSTDEKGNGKLPYAVVYQLLSVTNNQRLRLRVFAEGEPPSVDSVTEIWSSANWFERETFDLFGILFAGHPDLRRILTDYGFVGHPFRKDFPLEGKVEVRYDPEKRRVIYQPVSIENRVLVPRVIRDDKIGNHQVEE